VPWPLLALMEFAMVFGGGVCTLIGFRLILVDRPDPFSYRRWYDRSGRYLMFLGPVMLVLAIALPLAFGIVPAPPWVAKALVLAVGAGFVVFVVATWKAEPPVLWPKGVFGWLGYLFTALCFSAVLAGILGEIGIEIAWKGPAFLALYVFGLVLARTLSVWMARFKRHTGDPGS